MGRPVVVFVARHFPATSVDIEKVSITCNSRILFVAGKIWAWKH